MPPGIPSFVSGRGGGGGGGSGGGGSSRSSVEAGIFSCSSSSTALEAAAVVASVARLENRKTQAERLREIDEEASDSGSHSAHGQQFDENGTPITAPTGKKLTPADMFNPGDVITVTVGKSNPKQDPGLKVVMIS